MIHKALISLFLLLFTQLSLASKPALILQITVDQLRSDLVTRNTEHLGKGGFRYLLENGVVYTDARFSHANTMTAVGHATLATGGHARQHGIVANDWYDRSKGRVINSVEDRDSPYIGGSPGSVAGRSPRNLIGSTFSDELVLASGGASRAYGVSTKDRGAILTAGRRGQAYWYSTRTGNYVTTTWYRDALPAWVKEWNARKLARSFGGKTWELSGAPDSYAFIHHDDRPFEMPRGGMGVRFPHRMNAAGTPAYFSDLRYTPWADELTLSFTLAMMKAEEIGQRGTTDYLSISFSATDYIGHAYGPNSLEAEDNIRRLDRVLAELFSAVDAAVGLEKTLIVLSADHGVQSAPEYVAGHGIPSGRLGTDATLVALNAAMSARYGTGERLVAAFSKPSLYLDYEALGRAGIERGEAERALAEEVAKMDGFAFALTRSELLNGNAADSDPLEAVRNAFHPVRSGDVYAVSEPFWYVGQHPNENIATHGTMYVSDLQVPLMFAGPGIEPGTVHRRVAPRDLAPTLSAIMGIVAPSGSVGEVLHEVAPDWSLPEGT